MQVQEHKYNMDRKNHQEDFACDGMINKLEEGSNVMGAIQEIRID